MTTRRAGLASFPPTSWFRGTSRDVRPPMSAGPADTVRETDKAAPQIARSAVVLGTARLGEGSLLAQGAVVRSRDSGVEVGTGSAVLENSVVVGTSEMSTSIGRRSVFGHRCIVTGSAVGDLCEIGNASVLMPGAHLGNRVFLGEGTLVPTGMSLPDDSVAVGRPARIVRTASPDDLRRLAGLRDGDLSVPAHTAITIETTQETIAMGQLYAYRDIVPTVAASATLFPSAEITGDVVVGERTIIGAGVKIIGDSHGPVRIGNDVQILENTVLHLLPDNDLIIDDGVIVGPGAMIHGCRIGAGSVIEPGAIVCDHSVLGEGCVVRAGAVVKQRSQFAAGTEIDGFPAVEVGRAVAPSDLPAWALRPDDLPDASPAG
jgi:carbonic anhydrase/acetyltransferase-like protein (isoleucine patch superfamily)